MKTVVIISVHAEKKNCFSSKDFNGYKDFENEVLAHAFIKSNSFSVNEVCIDYELDIRLIYLTSLQYNRNRELAEQLFTEGLSEDSLKYWDKQEEIRNVTRKEEGFVFCKRYDEMTSEDYKGSLEKALTKTTIDYISSGVVAGYPVVDIKITVYDGSYHDVDSSEAAFKVAGSMAFKAGCKMGDPILLEPVMRVEVETPDQYMGDVTGSLSSKRGQIQGTESIGNGISKISAFVPLSELFGYTSELRSITSGRGSSNMEPSHYAEVPKNVAEEISGKR